MSNCEFLTQHARSVECSDYVKKNMTAVIYLHDLCSLISFTAQHDPGQQIVKQIFNQKIQGKNPIPNLYFILSF